MSHDRGCPCGREKWEYRECALRLGSNCSRYNLVVSWPVTHKPRIRVKAVTRRIGEENHEASHHHQD